DGAPTPPNHPTAAPVRPVVRREPGSDDLRPNPVRVDLRLTPSLDDVKASTWGEELVIVADVEKVLHFRVFAADGMVVVDTDEKRLTEQAQKIGDDTDEKRLTEQAQKIGDLRKQLEGLWPPHELTPDEKLGVIAAVFSIVGHTRD